MAVLTLKVIASLLQLHGPGATIESDHPGIDALLGDVRGQISDQGIVSDKPAATEVYFRRGGFIRGDGLRRRISPRRFFEILEPLSISISGSFGIAHVG